MSKLAALFQLGAAGVLTVPALVDDSVRTEGLQASLAHTVAALEELAGIQRRAAEEPIDVDHVLAITSAPILQEQERDERLSALRIEVSHLQQLVEEREATLLTGPIVTAPQQGPPSGTTPSNGLDATQRRDLAAIHPPVPGKAKSVPPDRVSHEKPGFSADPIRHGRAYYRAGRYEDAIQIFETLGDDIEAVYWIGRALERMDKSSAALEYYQRVAESEDAGPLKQRAAQDMDFLEWKVRFESRRKSRNTEAGGVRE